MKVQFSKTMALATVLALSGIAASQATTESASAATGTLGDYVTKEFLSDYSKLSPMEGDESAYRYVDKATSAFPDSASPALAANANRILSAGPGSETGKAGFGPLDTLSQSRT